MGDLDINLQVICDNKGGWFTLLLWNSSQTLKNIKIHGDRGWRFVS